ncbi:hypothetical protein H072_4645 [Dactylellina haptotyla CBS 200.50]|uniref:Membrane protein TMS1 n=1 Tax=Dactylellina haptotyla (strain CBS 200.50) TaxID=1284197 RepID=S8AEX1_DACHA|nr:hypothetical protein H072_4645 [Dactylellina haptotyla CBS 200.50]
MGALLSLPLMAVPSMTSMITVGASCCGAATCSAIFNSCGKCHNSTATRIVYALILAVNSIFSWIMLTPWIIKKLQKLTLDYMTIKCLGEDCFGFVAVHRFNFALGLFHFALGLMLLGVRSTKNGRATIQNGYWGPKILAWLGLIVLTFFIPEEFFVFWGNRVAIVGAGLFLFLGLILLVDLAHTWAETCLKKVDETDSNVWRFILVGSTLGMYLISLTLTIIMYIFFGKGDCSMNISAITINMLLAIVVSAMSIHPAVQEANSQAGLAQSAMVAVYCTYLTMSAVAMEPDDKYCNPWIRARGTRTASIVIGALLTLLTVAYTTTRAATQGFAMGSSGAAGYTAIGDDEHGLVTREPSRHAMRQEVIKRAVAEGSLPASALDDDSDDEDDEDNSVDDEKGRVQYNYTLFHFIFMLATAWVATLLTMSLEDKDGDFTPVGRTYGASWTKIISAWVCYGLYSWSLIAPVVLPDRFG